MKSKQIVGSFEIGHTLGQGTFGKVKLGRHVLTEQNVAVKIFQKERLDKACQVKRILKEISILKEMKHPNIIRIYEIVQAPSQLYLVMQYVEKGELFEHIKANKRLTEKIAAKFYYQLLSAIEYMHSLNIAHRDLKPENILLTNSMDIKIVDFGLSTHFEEGVKLKSSCGSPCYALPEMLIGQKYTAKEADIWSSGIVLFTMVCGYLPFQDTDIRKLHKKMTTQQLQFVNQNSSDLKDLLRNILNKNREQRYSLQQIKYHRWLVRNNKEMYQQNAKPKPFLNPFNEMILNEMEIFGVEASYAKSCLQGDKFNFATTLYHLLEKKTVREGSNNLITNTSTALSIKERLMREESFQIEEGLPTLRSQINEFRLNNQIKVIRNNFTKQTSSISPNLTSRNKEKNQNNSQTPKKTKPNRKSNSERAIGPSTISSSKQPANITPRSNHRNKCPKRSSRNDEYFVGKKQKQRLSKKKISMYQKMDSEAYNMANNDYERVYFQKERKLTKHKQKS